MSAYPPALQPAQLAQLSHDARDFALSRGLAYRPLPATGAAPPQSSAIHAPLALLPTPWPREAYAHAQRLMPLYSALYARVAADGDWLEATLRLAVRGDSFAEALWRVWQEHGRSNEQVRVVCGSFWRPAVQTRACKESRSRRCTRHEPSLPCPATSRACARSACPGEGLEIAR
jgi:hypothetical protein